MCFIRSGSDTPVVNSGESTSEISLAGMMVPIARQSNLGELAYTRLKAIIIRGAYPADQKLTVRSVAAALGVSTTPARDAINRLLAEGALVNEGPKTVVLPLLTREALEEITATRLALEGLASERSVLERLARRSRPAGNPAGKDQLRT